MVRGVPRDYRDRHPVAVDVVLVVNVVDGSLSPDRSGLRRYAWFAIPTVWIINLRGGNVEVYSDPSGPTDDPGYATRITRTIGESLDLEFDGQRVEGLPVADLFG